MSIVDRRVCPAKGNTRVRSAHRLLLSSGLMLAMAAPVSGQTGPEETGIATL